MGLQGRIQGRKWVYVGGCWCGGLVSRNNCCKRIGWMWGRGCIGGRQELLQKVEGAVLATGWGRTTNAAVGKSGRGQQQGLGAADGLGRGRRSGRRRIGEDTTPLQNRIQRKYHPSSDTILASDRETLRRTLGTSKQAKTNPKQKHVF